MAGMPSSTIEDLESTPQDIRGLCARRASLAGLGLVLAAGLLGLLGTQASTTSADSDGWTLDLEYPSVARAGLDVPFTATITRVGGFDEHVTLALTGTYLDLFETQGFHPEPDSTSRDGEMLYLRFEAPPDGDTFVVTYDAYIQPAAQSGADGVLSVMHEGVPVASVDFATRIWP